MTINITAITVIEVYNALKVISLDSKISEWLTKNDPMALKQVRKALDCMEPLYEVPRQCIHCAHSDIVKCVPGIPGLYGSAFDYCTNCDRPWNSESVECEHCGTTMK